MLNSAGVVAQTVTNSLASPILSWKDQNVAWAIAFGGILAGVGRPSSFAHVSALPGLRLVSLQLMVPFAMQRRCWSGSCRACPTRSRRTPTPMLPRNRSSGMSEHLLENSLKKQFPFIFLPAFPRKKSLELGVLSPLFPRVLRYAHCWPIR